jgi:hypothetical protein
MKKKHLAEDIFGGDELQHKAADQELCQTHKRQFDLFAENSDVFTNFELESVIKIVVSVLGNRIRQPDNGVIARELEKAPDLWDFVKECIKNRDYKSIRNLGMCFSSQC